MSEGVGCSPKGDRKFELAVKLSKVLGEANLGSGGLLREQLYLGQRISLWDIVTTALVLYRFPLSFVKKENGTDWLRRLACHFRPYQGLAARFRDFVTLGRNQTKQSCMGWPEGSRTVVVTCFTKSFYHQLLQPVVNSIANQQLAKVVVVHDGSLKGVGNLNGSVIFHSIWDHWDAEVDKVQQTIRRNLRKIRRELFNPTQFKSLMDDVRGHVGDINVKGELLWLFWREFIRLAPLVGVAEHIIFWASSCVDYLCR